MTLYTLIDLAKAYANLGTSAQQQLEDVLLGQRGDCTPDTLSLLADWLRKVQRRTSTDATLQADLEEVLVLFEA